MGLSDTKIEVAVLFAREDSIYKDLPGVDVYDIKRDARTFPGGIPVVAHPPCRSWGRYKHMVKDVVIDEHKLGFLAVDLVRKYGGVVEHPNGSSLFKECNCGKVGGLPDDYGGVLIQVDQWVFGHKARKRTLLYIVGTRVLPNIPERIGVPIYTVEHITKKLREATPKQFAEFLIQIARGVKIC